MKLALILLAALSFSLPAWGQKKTQARIILDKASAGIFPHDWIVVPVPEALFLNCPPSQVQRCKAVTAYTDLAGKVTFIREHYILTAPPARLHHTLLHEAGHIYCECAFEDRAELWANQH